MGLSTGALGSWATGDSGGKALVASNAGICPRIENLGRARSSFRTKVRRLEKGLPVFAGTGGLEAIVFSSLVGGNVVGVAVVRSIVCEGSVNETERMANEFALKLERSSLLTSAEFLLDDDNAEVDGGIGAVDT
jgi:hypothetical protein